MKKVKTVNDLSIFESAIENEESALIVIEWHNSLWNMIDISLDPGSLWDELHRIVKAWVDRMCKKVGSNSAFDSEFTMFPYPEQRGLISITMKVGLGSIVDVNRDGLYEVTPIVKEVLTLSVAELWLKLSMVGQCSCDFLDDQAGVELALQMLGEVRDSIAKLKFNSDESPVDYCDARR